MTITATAQLTLDKHFLRNLLLVALAILATSSALNVPPAARSISLDAVSLPGKVRNFTVFDTILHTNRSGPSFLFVLRPSSLSSGNVKLQQPLLDSRKHGSRFGKLYSRTTKLKQRRTIRQVREAGAGFHRDFGDLVDTQLPDPTKPIDSLNDLFPDGL